MATVIDISELPLVPNVCNMLLREVWRSPDGSASMAQVEVPVGDASQPHFHRGLTEIYYILSGEGEMVLDGEVTPVRGGMAILIPPGTVHHLRNTGSVQLVHLILCTPAFTPDDVTIVKEASHA